MPWGRGGVYDVGADRGGCVACVLVYFEVWDWDEAEEVAETKEELGGLWKSGCTIHRHSFVLISLYYLICEA